MSLSTDPRPATQSRPAWLVELLEVLELRRRTVLLAVGAVAFAGLLAAFLAPGLLPPRPEVGAAVGLAAVLLGVAVTFGLDSLDLRVRGPRHVRSSGGLLAQQLSGLPSPAALARLVTPLGARARTDGRVLVGFSPIDADIDAEGWQDALCSALADDGLRVLTVDLQRPAETHPGVVEVAEGRSTLADAVTFDGERMVARLGPGRDPAAALGGLRAVVDRLPPDIDVLVVLLPPPSGGGVLGASAALDHVYVLAEVDRTTRVDLIAALDAFDAVQASSEVLLLAPQDATAPPVPVIEVPADPTDEVPPVTEGALPGPAEPDPVDAEPVAEDPVAAEPVADEPVADEPVAAEPVAEEPLAAEPVVEEPATAEPAAMPPPAEPQPVAEDDPAPAAEPPPPVVEEPRTDDPQLRLVMAEAALELSGLAGADLPGDQPPPVDGPPPALDESDVDGDPTVETPPVVIEPEAPAAPDDLAPDLPDDLAPDLPDDPTRVAAFLQGIGAELWSPAPSPGTNGPSEPRVPAGPRG